VSRVRAPLLEINAEHPEPRKIQAAKQKLEEGRVIVYPTDTIYGLAAAIDNRAAIERLYALRKLDKKKPLSIVCASLSEVSRYAVVENEIFRVMKRVLPGPYTFVLTATREAPKMGDTKRRTVGIRFPAHPVSLALIAALGRPLLSTSAIIDEEEEKEDPPTSSPTTLADHYGAEGVALVLDAGPLEGTPSSVIDWTGDNPVILRRGAGDVSFLE
jgi:tRNA threonylcarbamoyl adenosine modification protein (Sua5/YciO/YrdC/YwlC family)